MKSGIAASAHVVSGGGSVNIGYRLFNGTTDRLSTPLAEIGGVALCPSTWLFAGRLMPGTPSGEIVSDAGTATVDWFYDGINGIRFFEGTTNSPDHSPDVATGVDFIVIQSLPLTGVMRYSLATHNGTVWSAFTHADSTWDPQNPTVSSTGGLDFGGTDFPTIIRIALLGHTNAVLTDAQRNTLVSGGTSHLSAWLALPSLTNLLRADQTPVSDPVGGWDQSSITGTAVTAAAFPILNP